MKRYSTVHPLFMSFYSRALYRDVGRNWKGISFLYLLLLIAICWIPVMFRIHSGVSDFLVKEAPAIVRQIPVIRIDHGKVSVDEKMPYFIRNPKKDEPLIIIDTTGQYSSLKGTDAWALLTKTELIMRKSPTEIRTFQMSRIEDLVINRAMVYNWIETFRKWFAVVLYPFAVLASYVYRIIQVLFYAFIGLMFAKNLGLKLDYQSLVSLAIIADTPSIIINTLYNYVDVRIPFWLLISFLIAMGYLFYGVKANSGKEVGIPAGD